MDFEEENKKKMICKLLVGLLSVSITDCLLDEDEEEDEDSDEI